MRGLVRSLVVAIIAIAAISCSGSPDRDAYLRSLKLKPEVLTALDSVSLEAYNHFQPNGIVDAADGWFVLSSLQGEYHLLFLNPENDEHFFAIRKGRGPGEIVSGADLHEYAGNARFYDFTSSKCIEIKLPESIAAKVAVCDTVADFSGGERPVYMSSCGPDRFVSGRISDDKVWYSLYDRHGKVLSSIDAIDINPRRKDIKGAMMLSSKYTSSRDGSRLCAANVLTPTISFASVSDDIISEVKRIRANSRGVDNGQFKDAVSRFNGICSDENRVYVLYSGRMMADRTISSDECEHLVVYDWAGNPIHHYLLNRPVCAISVSGNDMYAVSAYPSEGMFRFELPRDR
jgi:hypothetical protein